MDRPAKAVPDDGQRTLVSTLALAEDADMERLLHVNSEAVTSHRARSDPADVARAVLEALYLAHHETVFRYVRAISRNEDQALDITAIAFERAFRELLAGREPGLGWLLRTARNALIDADRRSRVAAVFRIGATEEHVRSPEDEILEVERALRVRAGLALLPPAQRHAIALRYSTDLTVREIGAVIGKSTDATQKLLDRGVVKLKETLNDLV